MTNNSFRYFANRECEYFPCHKGANPEAFNCLFCFCPLYMLPDCGGRFNMERGYKDCTACRLPHDPAGYDYILKKLRPLFKKKEAPAAEAPAGKQPPAEPKAAGILDFPRLEAKYETSPGIVAELLGIFMEDAPARARAAAKALESADHAAAAKAAHSLKGLAASIYAEDLAKAAVILEATCRGGSVDKARDLLPSVSAALEKTEAAIREALKREDS